MSEVNNPVMQPGLAYALGGPIVPVPMNYVQAFSPDSPQYSVNTGNANVRQLEDLRAINPAPAMVQPEPPNTSGILILSFIALTFFLWSK